jgi:hypothetical protein
MNKPPHSGQESNTHENNTIIIHRRDRSGKRVREAENDIKENYRYECHGIYRSAVFPHPEGSFWEIFPSSKEMSSYCQGIRCSSQNDKRAYEIRKRGVRTQSYGSESGSHEACEDSSLDRTRQVLVYLREEVREWRGVVAS